MMLKTFVHKRKDITEDELFDYNAFCQLLPGASSTQTLTLIGYKRGGVLLAVFTLIIWILPAALLMAALSFLVTKFPQTIEFGLLKYVPPMAIGFLVYAAQKAYGFYVKNLITKIIMVLSTIASLVFFKSPWVFPILILLGSIITNFSSKRIPQKAPIRPRVIKWRNIWMFGLIFILAGVLSEMSRKQDWKNRNVFAVFESHYRFGSFVFGGGDVLLPLMLDQFVERPQNPRVIARNPNIIKMEKQELLTGFGIVRAIPGPVFSIGSYTGGLALKGKNRDLQMWGCFAGALGLFLPSALLVLFFFPVWQNIKRFAIVYRSLEGIYAVIAGLMFAGVIYLLNSLHLEGFGFHQFVSIIVICATYVFLRYTKLPPPILVLLIILLGWLL